MPSKIVKQEINESMVNFVPSIRSLTSIDIFESASTIGEDVQEDQTTNTPFECLGKDNAYVNIRPYNEIKELADNEKDGYLTDRIIASCSTSLARGAAPGTYVLQKVDLSKKHLHHVDIIKFHHYLQYLDLSNNTLTSLSGLNFLPFLKHLDVSYNKLKKLLDFKPPIFLTYVNYKHNLIQTIPDLSQFWSLVHLDISNNLIENIEGVQKCEYLSVLNLSHNDIKTVKNLTNMNLTSINLNDNCIKYFESDKTLGLNTQERLSKITICNNKLTSLALFEGVANLKELQVSENCIKDLIELEYLKDLMYLTKANFKKNPIYEKEKYEEVCINTMKHIRYLDDVEIDLTKKGHTAYDYNHKIDGARLNATLIETMHQICEPIINSTVVPESMNLPPLMVLVGPQGSNKREVIRAFHKENLHYVKFGVSHTSRPKATHEVEGEDFYFLTDEDFNKMTMNGEFVSVTDLYGFSYGISRNELTRITEHVGVLVFYCDMSSALQLRAKFLDCHLILTYPSDEALHKKYITTKYIATPWIIDCVTAYVIKYMTHSDFKSSTTDMAATVLNDIIDNIDSNPDTRQPHASVCMNPDQIVVQDMNSDTSVYPTEGDQIDDSCQPANDRLSEYLASFLSEFTTRLSYGTRFSQRVTFPGELLNQNLKPSQEPSREQSREPSRDPSREASIYKSISQWKNEVKTNDYIEELKRHSLVHVDGVDLWCFLQDVMESRRNYLELHDQNTGLFYEVIYTDEIESAVLKLNNILKRIVKKQAHPLRKESRGYCNKILQAKLDMLNTFLN